MDTDIKLDSCYKPSNDVVAREVMGKILIVPLTSGIGDMEDEIFTLNEPAKIIWNRLVQGESVRSVIASLCGEFEAKAGDIEQDVKGLMKELIKRRMLEEVTND
jgi:hypothetical protein